jgi:aspartate/methionine/tyrosine aminotransferase
VVETGLSADRAAAIRFGLRSDMATLPDSGIVEVMKYGYGREGLIPLWAGEGDLPTPDFICAAAAHALADGETFYTWQRGIPQLRAALARYHARVYGVASDPERYFVTGSGMQAIVIAYALTLSAGDEIIVPSPAWPNAAAAAHVAGAHTVFVPMRFAPEGYTLDLERLADAITPRTRAIFINSPANPTGYVASRQELREVLALARKHGLWIVADEIYARFYWGEGERPPSFRDVMEPEDRILFVNTFSKNWAMTGWRMGWIEAHPSLGQLVENLIQYSTSGVPAFLQRAGVVALDQGENFLRGQVERARRNRALLIEALGANQRVRFAMPRGAFYLFFSLAGETDSRALAFRLVDEAGLGMAPGIAFGPGGEAFVRLCFLRSPDSVATAADRLAAWLRRS